MPTCERLQAGDLVAEVAPEIGGSLAAFYSAGRPTQPRRDWLRPATADALRKRASLDMASFPLLPWCNRIRDGRFEWNGRRVQLAPNVAGSPHTIHGIGWQRAWSVTARTASSIELALEVLGDGEWPFPFDATQRYELDPLGLTIELALRNTGTEPMPAGIGHHPYFPHRRDGQGTRVRAEVEAMWLSDAELLPTALSASQPAVVALRAGMPIADFALDNNFTGFGRRTAITWPDGSSLEVEASAPLDFFVLYTPAADAVFVAEAVSNCTDWINLSRPSSPNRQDASTVGGMSLAPGQVLRASTRFTPAPV